MCQVVREPQADTVGHNAADAARAHLQERAPAQAAAVAALPQRQRGRHLPQLTGYIYLICHIYHCREKINFIQTNLPTLLESVV